MMRWCVCAALAVVFAARGAFAAESVDVIVDKGKLLRLETNAKVVLVAQPGIADAVIESPRLIFILGRQPGETNLYILDAAGREIMNADVIVRPENSRHVSIHRSNREATMSCAPRCASVQTPGQRLRGRGSSAGDPPPQARSSSRPANSSGSSNGGRAGGSKQ